MRELIVDSFAGGGGASEGIELALGRGPDVAINHDPEALALHAANHPDTRHVPHNVWKVDPHEICGGRPVGLLWASPDCKHFSKAKGGRPVKRNIRDLAWVVVRWARQVRPRVIILENVEEFRDWGPVAEDGKPCAARKGQTFARWTGELRRLGYRLEHRELRACDYGAPTIRKRLFLVARRDGRPIVWPAPTHGAPDSEGVRSGRLEPWRTAAEIIDWSLPCHSIFLTREEGRRVGVNRPLAENTMARVAKGVKRYVLDCPRPFLVPITHAGDERAHDSREPLRTITGAQRGEHALVAPFVTKFRAGAVGHHLEEPLHTVTANGDNRDRPGGCAPLGVVSPFLARVDQTSGDPARKGVHPPGEPLRTVTTAGGIGVVAPHLMTMRNAEKPFSGAGEPTHTVTAGGAGLSLVAAFLAQHNYLEPGHDAREPVSTIVSKGCTQAVVSAGLLSMKGTDRRGSGVGEPARAVLAGGFHAAEVRAFLTKYYGADQDPRIEEPLHTATTKDRFGLVTVSIDGEPYVIADIGMRMLAPRELFRAQGFSDDYLIDRGRLPDGTWVALTKTAQVRMCGNSVCPPLAAALVAANFAEEARPADAPGRADAPKVGAPALPLLAAAAPSP